MTKHQTLMHAALEPEALFANPSIGVEIVQDKVTGREALCLSLSQRCRCNAILSIGLAGPPSTIYVFHQRPQCPEFQAAGADMISFLRSFTRQRSELIWTPGAPGSPA